MGAVARAAVVDACRYVDGWLAYRRRTERVPGVQAAVLHAGDVVLSCAHGVANIETGAALTTSHRFRIASHSKMFTATAAMQLVEQGALRLDDPASQWLAFLRGTRLASVTVRELLSHGGGVVRDGDRGDYWQIVDPFPDEGTLAAMAAAEGAAVYARNERFKYSNIGFGLAGLVIAAAGGRPYAEQVRERILEPFALSATSVDSDTDDASLATAHSGLSYADSRVPIAQVATGALAPATGFVSTATDVVRFAAAHCIGDERLLSDDGKRMMQRTEWVGEPNDGAYGLGMMVMDLDGRRVVGHGGGWPGHITRTLLDPDAAFAVTVCTNAIDGPATALAMTIVKLIDLAQKGDDERGPADPASFRGRFANLWGVFDLVDLGGRLYRVEPGGPTPVADAQHLAIVDDKTVLVTKASGFASPGERLHVERDEGGVIVAVRGASGMTSYPIDTVTRRVGELGRIRPGDRLGP